MLSIAGRYVAPDAMARAVVLHMGVALPPRPDRDLPLRPVPIVLCAARLVAVKGHSCLLDAAALLEARGIPFELWLAGDGPEKEGLRRHVEQLGLVDRVRSSARFRTTGSCDCTGNGVWTRHTPQP